MIASQSRASSAASRAALRAVRDGGGLRAASMSRANVAKPGAHEALHDAAAHRAGADDADAANVSRT